MVLDPTQHWRQELCREREWERKQGRVMREEGGDRECVRWERGEKSEMGSV